jgi:hypothetical protein
MWSRCHAPLIAIRIVGLSLTMIKSAFESDTAERIARAALALGPHAQIKNISIKEVGSPWDEKVRLRDRTGYHDVRLDVWRSPKFLPARIYRLVLYVLDSLDPGFKYDQNTLILAGLTSKTKETYNHIWSIYVDSRIEKMGFENFFDRILRRNLFVDSQKTYPWALSIFLFDKLWEKGSFTHQEIIEYSHNLSKLLDHSESWDPEAFEIEMNRSVSHHSIKKHVEKIFSPALRDIADTLLRFVTSRCRGTLIESSYYGIYFMYDQEIFAEMVTTKKDSLLITLFDYQLQKHATYIFGETEPQDIQKVQDAIKEIFDRISLHSHLKAIRDPYRGPIDR